MLPDDAVAGFFFAGNCDGRSDRCVLALERTTATGGESSAAQLPPDGAGAALEYGALEGVVDAGLPVGEQGVVEKGDSEGEVHVPEAAAAATGKAHGA